MLKALLLLTSQVLHFLMSLSLSITMSPEQSDFLIIPPEAISSISEPLEPHLLGSMQGELLGLLREKISQLEEERSRLEKSCIRGRQTELLLKQLYEEAESKVDERTNELLQTIDRLQSAVDQSCQVELKLREQEEYLKELFHGATDLIQIVSLSDDRIVYTNEAWKQSLEYSDLELSQISFIDIIHSGSHSIYTTYLCQIQTYSMNLIENIELNLKTKSGEVILVEGSIIYRMGAEQATTILCIFQNITDRQRAEANAQDTVLQAQELRELKSRFISMTSHEFRTPLAVISSSASILNDFGDRLDEDKKRHHLSCIQEYVRLTTQILDKILLLNQADVENFLATPHSVSVGSAYVDIDQK
jgi:PAS domain S-box-containing protein